MKIVIAALVLLFPLAAFSVQSDTLLVHWHGHEIYNIRAKGNNKLLIFLHGGVNNPSFKTAQVTPPLDYLLEGNNALIPLALANGFDVAIPVKNDSLNWLEHFEYCIQALKEYLDIPRTYGRVYLSGFSDGGTGAYRIFYSHPDFFEGLIVFNGYPQLNNFYKEVDYSLIRNKKVLFLSTRKDNVIPYEFLMTEYARQKKTNPDTYFYLADGDHSFGEYQPQDLERVFDMLRTLPDNVRTDVLHGYVRKDSLIEFYEFRQKISRKYGYEPGFLKENQAQRKVYGQR